MSYKELFEKTYRGKRVLLTGHTGFKGSWMLAWLHQLGANVKGYALEAEGKANLYDLIKGDTLCDSVIDDIRNGDRLMEVVNDFQPDFTFHFAAQPLVRKSYELPLYTFDVNAIGTANLLEAVKKMPSKCSIVIITTDKVYENNETGAAFKEDDKLGGYDPYSASKAAAEIIASSYSNSFFNPVNYQSHQKGIACARAGNVIGGGDFSTDRIIPDIIRGVEAGKSISIRNPNSVRPWQFVLEPLSGYLLLGAKLHETPAQYTGGWNFGPYTEDILTVKEVVEKALEVFGTGNYNVSENAAKEHEAVLLKLDISKAIEKLGWKPVYDARTSIVKTVEGYQKISFGENDFVYKQIEEFYKGQ